ncbi:MAG: HAD-IIIA family hydrolase [Desulfuromonadales bacterium]|nr:HAD-IIIA family hydrolase [Desulfuromonadales bacterium]
MAVDLNRIKLLLLDVDGVMTDGRIIYLNDGGEAKAFDVKDGHGLKLVQRAGIKVGIITGRQSDIVARRAAELGIELVYQGAKDKMQPFMEILEKLGLNASEVAYVGDDLVDLPVMRLVGFSATVADASDDIKPYVDLVTSRPGGRGAVREVCDLLLKQSSLWTSVTSRYFED